MGAADLHGGSPLSASSGKRRAPRQRGRAAHAGDQCDLRRGPMTVWDRRDKRRMGDSPRVWRAVRPFSHHKGWRCNVARWSARQAEACSPTPCRCADPPRCACSPSVTLIRVTWKRGEERVCVRIPNACHTNGPGQQCSWDALPLAGDMIWEYFTEEAYRSFLKTLRQQRRGSAFPGHTC